MAPLFRRRRPRSAKGDISNPFITPAVLQVLGERKSMSESVMRLVRQHSSLTGLGKSVLLAISHYAQDDGTGAYPSIASLMRDTGSSDRGVQKAINKAVKAGELKRFHNFGPNGVNVYEVRIDNLRGNDERASTKKRVHERPAPELCSPPEPGSDKGSGIRVQHYSEKTKRSREIKRQFQKTRLASDAFTATKSKSPSSLKCPDCRSYLARCRCDELLQRGFDAAMRDKLDAGKPGPARLTSERAL